MGLAGQFQTGRGRRHRIAEVYQRLYVDLGNTVALAGLNYALMWVTENEDR